MGRETVQVTDRAKLDDFLHDLRNQQIMQNARAVPGVLLASAATLAVGVSAAHADTIHPSEISKALRAEGRNTLVTDFQGQGNPYEAKYFAGPELQGGNDPFPPGTVTVVLGSGTNLRSEPNTSSRVVAELEANFQLTVVTSEFIDGYVWYQVTNPIYASEPSLWIRGDLVGRLMPSLAPAPEPGSGDPATLQPRERETLVPSSDRYYFDPEGVPTPSNLEPGRVALPMLEITRNAVIQLMDQHPEYFVPSNSEALASTGVSGNTVTALLRGEMVFGPNFFVENGFSPVTTDQMFLVLEVQSRPAGAEALSYFFIYRINLQANNFGGNVMVRGMGMSDPATLRGFIESAPADALMTFSAQPFRIVSTDEGTVLGKAHRALNFEAWRQAILSGTPYVPQPVEPLLQDAVARGASEDHLRDFMDGIGPGFPTVEVINLYPET